MSDARLALAARTVPFACLREAAWLHRERVRAYVRLFALTVVGVAIARFAARLDADYLSFWAAGRLVLAGNPAGAYDVAVHWAAQRAQFPDTGYFAFFYPPVFLLLCAPMAVLPFYWSMLVFLGATLLAYLRAMHRLLPGAGLALFSFPGVTVSIFYGQNGLLSAALLGGALAALPSRPLAAGICFGCLCYKPHLGLTVPLALLAARQWRAIAAAAATVAVLVGASAAAFGIATWRAFAAGLPLARRTLEQGLAINVSWASLFRAVVQLGAGVDAAYVVQAGVTLAAAGTLVVVCYRRPAAITGVLPLAALLSTPFLLAYDLTLLAIPMAWVVRAARRGGFLPWEKSVLGFAYVVPLLMLLGGRFDLPLGPLTLLALSAVVLRRAWGCGDAGWIPPEGAADHLRTTE
jgi:alpha-1,2-mannosyltransferase